MKVNQEDVIDLQRWRKVVLAVGVAGLLLTAGGLFVSREQVFRSYLWAFLYWFSVALGCLPLLMLYHLVGGAWGFTIRRIIESGTRTLPVIAILFIPIVFGIHDLYEWARVNGGTELAGLPQKRLYLNVPFWIIRAVLYFAVWLFYANRLNRLSALQDSTGDIGLMKRFQRVSGPGLLVYGFTLTFAVFDWAMSLEPQWYSTIYGMLWMVIQALCGLAFAITILATLPEGRPVSRVRVPANTHDLGNLLLAFVMLWAYLSFSQLLIIWSGNLPEEIQWYLSRIHHGWEWMAAALLVFHFFVPFFLLLGRLRKRDIHSLTRIAMLILFMQIVDTYWIVTPAFYGDRLTLHWLDIFALVGIGGIWLASYVRQLAALPLIPLHDPNAAPHKAL
jgi:hypothetical protein